MKKEILASALALSLVFSQGAFVFAEDAKNTKDAKPDEIETTAEIAILPHVNMTLEQAYERLKKDSPQAISADFIHESELAASKGYIENLGRINRNIDAAKNNDPQYAWFVPTDKPITQLRVDFAKVQAEKNYEAALNKLKKEVYEKYYTHKQAEAQLQAAKDNYDRAVKLKQEADLKYRVGKVSKLETLSADTVVNEALDGYEKAKVAHAASKMGYNLFMGYNVNQEFSLTNPLEPFELPQKGLDESVINARSNRNEIADARQKARLAKASLNMVDDYPHSSATYKKAKVNYDMALFALKNAPSNIEMDVRTKYATMKQNYDTVNNLKKNLENAKEVARLGQLQFNTGFITITNLQGLNLAVFTAQEAYNKAILDYNLSVTDYYQCSTVGLTSADI